MFVPNFGCLTSTYEPDTSRPFTNVFKHQDKSIKNKVNKIEFMLLFSLVSNRKNANKGIKMLALLKRKLSYENHT